MKQKSGAPSLEQWGKLYEVASVIKRQQPWLKLWDTDLFTLILPGQQEPVFVSAMGRNGECYGIGVYPGYHALLGLYRLMDASGDEGLSNPLAYQNCLMCYFGDRDELLPKDREVLKALDLKFRGKNNWVYFRLLEEGYYPWFLTAADAELMIAALQNYTMAYQHFMSGKLKVDFEGGQTLMRFYSEEREEWLNLAAPMVPVPEMTATLTFEDELLLKRLQKKPRQKVSLEVDILSLPVPVQEKRGERPYFPRLLVMFNRADGALMNQRLIERQKEKPDVVIAALIDYIEEFGNPQKLYVRDEFFLRCIESFCSQVGITALHGRGMPCVDEFSEQLPAFMHGDE